MDLDDLRDMRRHHGASPRGAPRARARAISDQVEVAMADGLGRRWTSRETVPVYALGAQG
jgi:hypothetical protein